MNAEGVITLVKGLVDGVPKLIEAWRAGRNLRDIKVSEFVSKDALAKIEAANARADDYIENG